MEKRQVACAVSEKTTDSMCYHEKKTVNMYYHGENTFLVPFSFKIVQRFRMADISHRTYLIMISISDCPSETFLNDRDFIDLCLK